MMWKEEQRREREREKEKKAEENQFEVNPTVPFFYLLHKIEQGKSDSSFFLYFTHTEFPPFHLELGDGPGGGGRGTI